MFLRVNFGSSEAKVLLLTDAGDTQLAGIDGAPARACTQMCAAGTFDAEGHQM